MTADGRRNGTVWSLEGPQKSQSSDGASYEEAVSATGYGLFNVLLLLAALPIAWTCIIDATSTAFILNSSECAFELTMFRRGVAVAAIYIGMVVAGPLWDFALQDAVIGRLGKKNVLVIGLIFDAMCNILCVHATTFYSYITLKIISGVIVAGPLSVTMAYVSEFHSPVYQPKFARWAGLLVLAGNIIPAALAATLLLRTPWFHFTIYNHFYPTWRVYLLICTIPSIFGLLISCLMPRSPKFLLAEGKTEEALRLMRSMYSMNKFKPSSEYPINELAPMLKVDRKARTTCKDKLKNSFTNIKTLFSKDYVKSFSIILILQFCCMIGFNVMRLWVPPLFVIMNNFRVFIRQYYPDDELITMCEMIFPRLQVDYPSCNHTLPYVESAVYVNSTSIATSAVTFSFIFSFLTKTKTKKIIVMIFTFVLSTAGCFGANWAINIPYMLISVAFVIVASRIAGNTVIAYNAEIIPQSLRPTSIGAINFTGNLGALLGNVVFAAIIEIDCLSAFLGAGFIALVCTVLPIFLIERSREEDKTSDIEKF